MVGARKMIAFFDDCTIGTQGRNKQHTARKDKRGLEEFSVFVGDFEGGGGSGELLYHSFRHAGLL